MSKARVFNVWIQGYRGRSCVSRHKHLGSFEAPTFYEACQMAIEPNKMVPQWLKHEDGVITYSGQQLFDDEVKASEKYYTGY